MNWPPAFVNKVLLTPATLICLCLVDGCFCATTGELSGCDRHRMANKTPKYLLCCCRKSSQTPGLDSQLSQALAKGPQLTMPGEGLDWLWLSCSASFKKSLQAGASKTPIHLTLEKQYGK